MKKVLLALAGVTVLSSAVAAQTVTTEKTAEKDDVISNSYSTIDLRAYQGRLYDGEVSQGTKKHLESRFVLGTKAFNKKLDANVTFVTLDKDNIDHPVNIAPWFYAEYKLLDGKYGTWLPYVDGVFNAHDSSATSAYVGGYYMSPSYESSLSFGALKINALVDTVAWISDQKEQIAVEREKEAFRLANNDDENTTKEDTSYRVIVLPSATLDLNAVKGLSLFSTIEYRTYVDPVYKYDAEADDKASLDGYATKDYTETAVGVGYKLTDKATISNTVFYRNTGLYGGRYSTSEFPNSNRVYNRAMVSYVLK